MSRALFIFRVLLVTTTASFMAFHTVIFINRIEPNLTFAWISSLLIEAMLISLALMRTWVSRLLLIPVFIISVLAASASFITSNEQLLDTFFSQKRVAQELQKDISDTERDLTYGQKYYTKTLQRNRQLKDELNALLKGQKSDLTLANSLLFLCLVLVLQSVSVYTAMHLKNGLKVSTWTVQRGQKSVDTVDSVDTSAWTENSKTVHIADPESKKVNSTDGQEQDIAGTQKSEFEDIAKLKGQGYSVRQIEGMTGISKSKIAKILKKNIQG